MLASDMGVVETIRSVLAPETEPTTKTYVCRDCDAEFETDTHPSDVTCRECGSEYVFNP